MARIHGLKHVQRLAGTHLADDDAIRPHTQRIAHQITDGHGPAAFDVLGTGFQCHHMLLLQAQLRRVLNGHDPFPIRNKGGKHIQRSGLA